MKFSTFAFFCILIHYAYSLKKIPDDNQTNVSVVIDRDKRTLEIHHKEESNIIMTTSKQFTNCQQVNKVKMTVTNSDRTFDVVQNPINSKLQRDEFLLNSYIQVESIQGFCNADFLYIQTIPHGLNKAKQYNLVKQDNQQLKEINFSYQISTKNQFPLFTIKVVSLQSKLNFNIEQTFLSSTGKVLFKRDERNSDLLSIMPSTFLGLESPYMSTFVFDNQDIKYIVFPKNMDFSQKNIYLIKNVIQNKKITTELFYGVMQDNNFNYQHIMTCQEHNIIKSNINLDFRYEMEDDIGEQISNSLIKDYRVSEKKQAQGLLQSIADPTQPIQCTVETQQKSNQMTISVKLEQKGTYKVQTQNFFKNSVLSNITMGPIQESDENEIEVQEIDNDLQNLTIHDIQRQSDDSLNQSSILKGSINPSENLSSQNLQIDQKIVGFQNRPQVKTFVGSQQQQNYNRQSGISFKDRPEVKRLTQNKIPQNVQRQSKVSFKDRPGVKQLNEEQLFKQQLKEGKFIDLDNLQFGDNLLNSSQSQEDQSIESKKTQNQIQNTNMINTNQINDSQSISNLSQVQGISRSQIRIQNDTVKLIYNKQEYICSSHFKTEQIHLQKKIKFYAFNFQNPSFSIDISFNKPFKKDYYTAHITDEFINKNIESIIKKDIDCQLEIGEDNLIMTILPKADNMPHISILKRQDGYILNGNINQRRFQCQTTQIYDSYNPSFAFQQLRDTATDEQNKEQIDLPFEQLEISDKIQKFIIKQDFRSECLYTCNFDTSALQIHKDLINIKLVQTCYNNAEYISIETQTYKQGMSINVIKQYVALGQEQKNENITFDFSGKQKDKIFLISQVLQNTEFHEFDYELNVFNNPLILLFFKSGTNILNQYSMIQNILEYDNYYFNFVKINQNGQFQFTNFYYIIKFDNTKMSITMLYKQKQKTFFFDLNESLEILSFNSDIQVIFELQDDEGKMNKTQQTCQQISIYYANIAGFQKDLLQIYDDFDVLEVQAQQNILTVQVKVKKNLMI